MPKYRVLEKSYIGNRIVPEGEIVDYEGEVSKNLEPVDKPAQAAAKAVEEVPKPVRDLVASLRFHAATRGVSPEEVNAGDFVEVLKAMGVKPDATVVDQAAAILKVELGLALA